MKKEKKVRIQITMSENVYSRIEANMKKNFMTKSTWFLKAALAELEKVEGKEIKKVIDLDE